MASDSLQKDPHTIQGMFNRIADNYDRLNRILSFGQDIKWRRAVAGYLPAQSQISLLDLATGTGDQILMLKSQLAGNRIQKALGIDISEEMLKIGRRKVAARGYRNIELKSADASSIPVKDASFDAVTMSFGIRNVQNVDAVLREMYRVLRKDGKVIILEFSLPVHPFIKKWYLYYFRNWIPKIGAKLAGDGEAYGYLNQSVESFWEPSHLIQKIQDSGFQEVSAHSLTFGVATIYVGRKDR